MTEHTQIAHSALPEPEGAAQPARWPLADVSERPWDGWDASLSEGGRMAVPVPPEVRDYVVREKALAAAEAARHPALKGLRNVAPQFEGATRGARDRLAALAAERADAVRISPESARAVTALLAPKVAGARAEVRDAVDTWRATFDAQLADAEKEAEAAVADLPHRVSPSAENRALTFAVALEQLTPKYAADALGRLAADVAADRERPDFALAILPMLMSQVEVNPAYDTPEMRQAVQVLEVAARDRHWHGAHQALTAIRGARERLRIFAEMTVDQALDARAPSFVAPLFADFRP